MSHLYSSIQDFLQDEQGVTSIEYGMIASLIAVVILGAVSALGAQVCARFSAVASALGGAAVACT